MTTDIGLQDQVLDELRWEHLIDPSTLRVEVHDGYVRLAGQVESEEARSAAEWAVRRVAGIKGVESELMVASAAPRIIQ
jgi:osmotically-inducible protein OsmY